MDQLLDDPNYLGIIRCIGTSGLVSPEIRSNWLRV